MAQAPRKMAPPPPVEEIDEAAIIADAQTDAYREETRESFEIMNDVEIPERRARQSKYPWDKLEPGQSFFVKGGRTNVFSTLCSTKNKYDTSRRFTSREWHNADGDIGVMVWRLR